MTLLLVLTALALAAFTCATANRAEAHASLLGYMTTPPSSWEPLGFNITGTTANYVVKNLGWNATYIGGNVGIGNGSYSALKQVSNTNNLDFDPNQYFMTGDITTAPWDPARISNLTTSQGNETATNETGGENATKASNATTGSENGRYKITGTGFGNISMALPQMDRDVNNNSTGRENATAPEASNETPAGNSGKPMKLNDQYHSILFGRPVNDLMYEIPVSRDISGVMYFRLVGLRLPGGEVADVGMRALSYGY